MSRRSVFCAGLLCIAGILLTGCQTVREKAADPETRKQAAKIAVKAAIRHSPAAVLRAVK